MSKVVRQVFGVLLMLTTAAVAEARTKHDEEALRDLPKAFCDAWAQHDGHALARTMADDVDFVTVGATWFHGRADFEKYHTRLLNGRFKESTIALLETSLRFLRSDLAVVYWSWSISGDKNADGSARAKRFGLMTMLAEKRKGLWLVVAAQNTNGGSGPPELEGIKSPIVVPRPDSNP